MIRLVFYDITGDKARRKLVDQLEYFGMERVQHSVFWGQFKQNHWKKAWKSIGKLFVKYCDPETDRIYSLVVEWDQLARMKTLGFPPETDELLHESLVLLL